jgi:alpha/beta superfamily hydrolase
MLNTNSIEPKECSMRLSHLVFCFVGLCAAAALSACGESPEAIQQQISEVAAVEAVEPSDLVGPWRGDLDFGPMTMRVELRLREDGAGLSGDLVSVDQGNAVITLEVVSLEGSRLHFADSGRALSYEGVIGEDGLIVGMFTQQGSSFALTFERGAVEVEETPEPAAPELAPDETETVVLATDPAAGDPLTLAGVLRQPEGARAGVVILSGSSPQDRNGLMAGQPIYAAWAELLAENGVASLRLDDRGVGGSDRVIPQSPRELGADAAAALGHLRAETGLSCVGFVGHSEGGWIALLAAPDAEPNFIVSMAGMHEAMEPTLIRQSEAIIRASGGDDAAVAGNRVLQDAMFEVLRTAGPDDDIPAQLEAALLGVGAPANVAESQAATWGQPYAAAMFQTDPADAAADYPGPVLALFGGTDTQVIAEPTSAVLVDSRPEGETRTVTIEGVDHLFQDNASGSPAAYGSAGHAISPEAAEVMVIEIGALLDQSCGVAN